MEEIGLFPLGIVLLPSELVPLHIFEPRYRELIGECVDEEREFGLVFAGDDGLSDVGTRTSIVEVVDRLPDGRLNIVVEGRARFRLLGLTEGRSFHTGTVDELVDADDPAATDDVQRTLELFERVLTLTGAEIEAPSATDPQLSFTLAGRFELAADLKQSLLAATSERARLARVHEILEAAAAAVERQRDIAVSAGRNGRVHQPPS
jgi:Lon protease-like protein